MKNIIALIFLTFHLFSFSQNEIKYYENGVIKSEWKIDTIKKTVANYFYFETGEQKSIGIFDTIGVLQDYFYFNQKGDTINKSHIPEFKDQPKKDLTKIQWNYTKSGIGYYIENDIKGKIIKQGDSIKVWYIGYFENGEQFDNSDISGLILDVVIGEEKYLESFENGLMLFKRNQRGFIKIPSTLGYGDKPAGNIPPNSTLIYEIEIK